MRIIILIASLGLLFIAHHIDDGSFNFGSAMNHIVAWACFGIGCIGLVGLLITSKGDGSDPREY